ncbi:MAG: GLUG motif-containing protein, partial [Christensenellales bacterium]
AGTYGDIVLKVTWKLANVNVSMQYVLDNYTVEGITKDGYYGSAKTISKNPKLKLSGDVTWQNASETTFDNFAGITAFNSAKSYGLITYVYGTDVVLTITVGTEYELKALYINGILVNLSTIAFTNGTATYDLGSVTADTTILAKFERKKVTIQLELITNGSGVLSTLVSQGKYSSGVITADGTSISSGATITKYYGDSSTFIIMPNAGYVVTSLIKPGESTSVSNPSMTYSIGISYVTSGKLSITLNEQDTWLNHASTDEWSTDKVVITTANQLALLSKKILLGEAVPSEIVLGADIDLTGHNWFPIGTTGNPFAQKFDGDSYTISNMTVLNGTAIGLFGYNSGTVYNVKVSGSATGGQIVGGVVGHNSGNVEYVANSVETKGMSELEETTNAVGGVVGYNTSNIFASYNTASVTGNYYVGGIVGYNSGTIKNAYNTGAIANNSSSSDASVGGIAGYTTNTNIGYVYNIGSISHDNNTPYSHFAGNMALTLPRYYLSTMLGSDKDTGCGLSQENLQPISTAEFNSSTYFANWNSASSNGYQDNIWEINPQDNGGYAYPTFTLQKGFVGTVTITSSFEASAEAGAVAFVTITSTSGNTWKLILYRGAVYTITKLAENEELTIAVTSTINHTATASLNTLTLTSESNTITVTIQKTSSGTFYAGTVLQAPTTQELQIQAEDLTYTQEVEIQPEVEEETVQEETEQTNNIDDEETVTTTSQRVTQEKLVYSTETTDLQSSKKIWSMLNNKKRSFARYE